MFNKIKEFMGLESAEVYEDYDHGQESVSTPTGTVSTQTYGTRLEESSRSSRYAHPETESPTGYTNTATFSGGSTSMNSAASSANNVIGMPNSRWWGAVAEVVVMEPRSFDEMPQVIQSLKDRKSVVLNLTMMDADEAQRAVDFVAGATFTIDGHQERIGESIFLFTPSCVQVSTQAGVVREVPQPQVHPMQAPTPAWNTTAAM